MEASQRDNFFAVEPRAATLNTRTVSRLPTSRPLRVGVILVLQAVLWAGLTLAFAALIEVAGWSPRREALIFSATNWAPWIVLAPIVFWLARRFPLERGRLLRSIPVHVVACLLSCIVMMWVSAHFAPWPRGGRLSYRDGRAVVKERRDTMPPRPPGEVVMIERTPREPRPKGSSGSGYSRGSGGPGGSSSGAMGERFLGRFWPPFSSIVLRANVSAAVYLIIACFAHAFAYYHRAREREKEAIVLNAGLSRAKLDALRLQLQPHFLFNTLNAISTLVHRDADAADELIGDLSELLRLSLQTSEHEVPLSRELELLDCYLAIERTRLGDRLKLVREIDPQALCALVPTFVLQPLAENAIRHGIEPRRAAGTLTVRADLVGGNLRLVVADDGVGLQATGQRSTRRGIGIANTEQRLRALHGDAAHLDLVSPESGGVQVQIVLPWRITPSPLAAGTPA